MAVVDICLPLMIMQPAQGKTSTRRWPARPNENNNTGRNTKFLSAVHLREAVTQTSGAASNPSGCFRILQFNDLHQENNSSVLNTRVFSTQL